jgi:integrase
MVLLAGWGGLRFGEVAALRRDRLRLFERRVDVVEGLSTDVAGKTVVGPLKTATSRRSVTIPEFLVEELAAHVAAHPDALEDLLFTAPMGGPIQRTSWRTRFWLPAVRSAGVDHATFHGLRHHAAAAAIAAGAHPKAISARLGHASVSMTLDTYGHLFPSMDEDLATHLDTARRSATSVARSWHEGRISSAAVVTPIRGKRA